MDKASHSTVGPGAFQIGPGPMAVLRDGAGVSVVTDGATVMRLHLDERLCRLKVVESPAEPQLSLMAISAATEAVFGWHPALDRIVLDGTDADQLLNSGLAVRAGDDLVLLPELCMQRRDNWIVDAGRPPFPQFHLLTDGKRHPGRPPKPAGMVYARFIPWLAETISFHVADPDDHLELFHRWMNDPRVDAFWNEAGDLEKHKNYLSGILADPHMLPLIGFFGDAPFGYFEVYWAKENRIAPFYDANDYDRGWHVVVGEDDYRGRHYISAWLPSLMHYMFLDDCRTQRIVGEPAAAHAQQLRNLQRSGFASIKNFDFPHKRATLVMLLRERFFGDRLWLPAANESPAAMHR